MNDNIAAVVLQTVSEDVLDIKYIKHVSKSRFSQINEWPQKPSAKNHSK